MALDIFVGVLTLIAVVVGIWGWFIETGKSFGRKNKEEKVDKEQLDK